MDQGAKDELYRTYCLSKSKLTILTFDIWCITASLSLHANKILKYVSLSVVTEQRTSSLHHLACYWQSRLYQYIFQQFSCNVLKDGSDPGPGTGFDPSFKHIQTKKLQGKLSHTTQESWHICNVTRGIYLGATGWTNGSQANQSHVVRMALSTK